MHQEEFAIRLARLRNKKIVSARDMSLSIGQNPGYINTIESGKALPSMTAFFYICDYLNISPRDFFDDQLKAPDRWNALTEDLKKLDEDDFDHVVALVHSLSKK